MSTGTKPDRNIGNPVGLFITLRYTLEIKQNNGFSIAIYALRAEKTRVMRNDNRDHQKKILSSFYPDLSPLEAITER